MSLVPHKIVALEGDTATAISTGKTTIASAVVVLYDSDNNAITLYDDAAFANGASSKVTGSTGELIVWITAGQYTQSVNGSTALPVTVGSASPVTVDTFANMLLLRPEQTDQAFTCQERANAKYILKVSGYVALAGDATFANSRVAALQINSILYSAHMGVNESNADNFALITACITRAKASAVGLIDLPSGTIKTSDEIVLDYEGLSLKGQGAGSFQDGTNRKKTELQGTKTTKSVVRIMLESCGLSGMVIGADSTRAAAARDSTAAGYNGGVRVESEDVAAPEGDVFDTSLKDLHVTNQPNHGIAMVGRTYGSTHERVICTDNNGHGVLLTNGELTGRTNTAISGVVTFTDCTWFDNEGHSVSAGRKNATDYTLRLVFINCEGLYNGGTPSLLTETSDSFFNCDSLTVINGAATGTDKARTDDTLAGYAVMGGGGTFIDSRVLDTLVPFKIIKDSSRRTEGWNILSPKIRGTAADHVAELDTGVEDIVVNYSDRTTAGVTKATNITGGVGLTTIFQGSYFTTNTATFSSSVVDGGGLSMQSTKLDNQTISTAAATILDAATTGKMYAISARHSGDPCLSSFTATVVGGGAPVITGVQNQDSASITYLLTVSGTNIQLATSAGTRTTDVFIKELATQ